MTAPEIRAARFRAATPTEWLEAGYDHLDASRWQGGALGQRVGGHHGGFAKLRPMLECYVCREPANWPDGEHDLLTSHAKLCDRNYPDGLDPEVRRLPCPA